MMLVYDPHFGPEGWQDAVNLRPFCAVEIVPPHFHDSIFGLCIGAKPAQVPATDITPA